jgi:hypothetical protein
VNHDPSQHNGLERWLSVLTPPVLALAVFWISLRFGVYDHQCAMPYDDSYIFIRYAQQFARGNPMQWSDGVYSSGASSMLFTWLLVPGQWLSTQISSWGCWSIFVGGVSLWFTGMGAASLTRALGLGASWALSVGVLCVVWPPLALSAMAGMDTALGAGWLLWGLSLIIRRDDRRYGIMALLFLALAPLVRQEFILLSGLGSLWIFWRPPPWCSRWLTPLLLVPGLGMMMLYRLMTGELLTSGALSKSLMSTPYIAPTDIITEYTSRQWKSILPVYLGRVEGLSPGWWAGAGAVFATASLLPLRTLRPLRPASMVWFVLFLTAPLSLLIHWQFMRHHQPALMLAFVIALLAVGLLLQQVKALGYRARTITALAIMVVTTVAWSTPQTASTLYSEAIITLKRLHFSLEDELNALPRDTLLMINDAGVHALMHDGPMLDLFGLGTPSMIKPKRHGSGSLIEELVRQPRIPDYAIIDPTLFTLDDLLLSPVRLRDSANGQQMWAGPVNKAALAQTAAPEGAIDLAYLLDEASVQLVWMGVPLLNNASLTYLLAEPDGALTYQGCRPVTNRLGVNVGAGHWRVRFTVYPGRSGTLQLHEGDAEGAQTLLAEVPLANAPHWQWVDVTTAEPFLWMVNKDGPVCIEAIVPHGAP